MVPEAAVGVAVAVAAAAVATKIVAEIATSRVTSLVTISEAYDPLALPELHATLIPPRL